MSEEIVPRPPIVCDRLWEDIETIGYREGDEEDDGLGWITDGVNCLKVNYCGSTGYATFTRYGGNDIDAMLDAIAAHFKVEMISEHDDAFDDVVKLYYPDDYQHEEE